LNSANTKGLFRSRTLIYLHPDLSEKHPARAQPFGNVCAFTACVAAANEAAVTTAAARKGRTTDKGNIHPF
jgi:hypothetical protein